MEEEKRPLRFSRIGRRPHSVDRVVRDENRSEKRGFLSFKLDQLITQTEKGLSEFKVNHAEKPQKRRRKGGSKQKMNADVIESLTAAVFLSSGLHGVQ